MLSPASGTCTTHARPSPHNTSSMELSAVHPMLPLRDRLDHVRRGGGSSSSDSSKSPPNSPLTSLSERERGSTSSSSSEYSPQAVVLSTSNFHPRWSSNCSTDVPSLFQRRAPFRSSASVCQSMSVGDNRSAVGAERPSFPAEPNSAWGQPGAASYLSSPGRASCAEMGMHGPNQPDMRSRSAPPTPFMSEERAMRILRRPLYDPANIFQYQ